MVSPSRGRRFRFLALLLGVLGGFLALEAGLRLASAPASEVDVLSKLAETFEPPPEASDCRRPAPQARLREIVVPSPHPDVVYELRPAVETCFEGVPVRINAQGVRRSAELRTPKPEAVYRILALGDSHAFGWAIPEEATVAAQLEARLADLSGAPVEVVNAGVPGYSFYQEAAWLEGHGRGFEPDCVLVLFVANDMGLPHFLLKPRPPGPSRVWDRVRAATSSKRWFLFAPNELATFVEEVDLERIPARYRHMVGEDGYRVALRTLSELAAAARFEVVNVFDYSTLDVDAQSLVGFQRGLGIAAVEMPWPAAPSFRVSATDPHLNRAGNAVVVEFVLDRLFEVGKCLPPEVRGLRPRIGSG